MKECLKFLQTWTEDNPSDIIKVAMIGFKISILTPNIVFEGFYNLKPTCDFSDLKLEH